MQYVGKQKAKNEEKIHVTLSFPQSTFKHHSSESSEEKCWIWSV